MKGTTVVLNAPDPMASNTQAVMTPAMVAVSLTTAGREVVKRTVAPIASTLLQISDPEYGRIRMFCYMAEYIIVL